jgi:hypothetical protein
MVALESVTIPELKQIAKHCKVVINAEMKKADLIKQIRSNPEFGKRPFISVEKKGSKKNNEYK